MVHENILQLEWGDQKHDPAYYGAPGTADCSFQNAEPALLDPK